MKKLRSISFQKTIRRFLQIIAILTLLIAVGWFIFEPGFEPVLAILASVAVFLSPLFLNLEEEVENNPLPLTDDCEFATQVQVDNVDVGSTTMGGGGIANFLHDYQAYFGGRHDEMAELDAWLTQTEKRFGLLVAPAGMGKSALVANWSKHLRESGQAIVAYHPISLRYGTNSRKQTLYNLLMQISDADRKEANLTTERPYVRGLDLIDQSFNKEELQELCLHLSVDYDNLGEGSKRDKARELIHLCERTDRLDELARLCQDKRPRRNWASAFPSIDSERALYEPPQDGDDELFLSSQLRENLRQPTGWDKPLVVVIDGLDELANQLNQPDIRPVGFLPNETEKGIYILAVARGESNDARDAWQRALGWEKSLVHSFVLGTLQKKDIWEMVGRSSLGVKNDFHAPLADKIYELSEGGDPLITSLWLDWLAKQADKEPSSLLENLEGQSPGINTYIEGILSQIDPLINKGAKSLFEVLSLARGPLSARDLYALGIKIDSGQLDRLVNLSGRLIIRIENAYVFSHSRIRQAVQEKFVSPERRQHWLEQFHRYGRCSLKQASKMPDGRISTYILSHYAEHLYLDKPIGYEPSLYALVDKAWMKAHYEHSGSYDDFLMDVDRALATAAEAGMKQAANGQSIDQISLEIKGLMCHASITALSGNLSPHLPALLVRDHIWIPQQAVSHVQRIPDLAQRTQALVTLLTVEESEQIFRQAKNQYLRNVIVSSSLRNMQILWQQNKVDEAELYQLQLAISPCLSTDHVDEALLLAGKVQRSMWRARLLAELLPLIEDEAQQIQTIKKIIHACSMIDESFCSKDIPFIVPTFTTIAQNLSMKQLAIAFAEIWGEESRIISNQELAIDQAKDDPSMDERNWRRLHHRHGEYVENRERKKRILDYLAWHIEKHQATSFVELLSDYDSLPQVAEKISRFACKLDDETAYNIAVQLKEEFATAPQEKRRSYGMGSIVEGVGIAFITLAMSRKGEFQQKILEVTGNYIQTYGAEDSPYGEQDLWLFYQVAAGQLTDEKVADLVHQGKFMRRFWRDGGNSSHLSMYSQEIIAYLEGETLKVLFERCIESESTTSYWHITESPYILRAIAEKLPDEELGLIYEIGHSRGESCGYYGYVRSATEKIKCMPESVRLDTIHWALTGWVSDTCLEQAIAPFITPNMISDRYLRTNISASMARHLPRETVQYIVANFEVSRYGEAKGTEVLLRFIQYLPETERKSFLQSMEAGLFQIKDNGELSRTINVLERRVQLANRRQMRRISQSVKTEIGDAYLLADLEEEGPFWGMIPADKIPFAIRGNSFRLNVFHAPISFFRAVAKPLQLLRLKKSSYQAAQKHKEQLQKQIESPYSSLLDSWLGRVYYRTIQRLASSRFTWILYLLCMFALTIVLLLISFVVALFIFPFFVLLISGYLLLMSLGLGKDWLKDRIGKGEKVWPENKKDKASIWKAVQNQVQALNHLPESKDREDTFVQIAHKLGDVVRLIGSRDYKEYAANAEEIWSELRPEFVLDALAVLDKHAYDESHDYVRAILPAVVLKAKDRLPDLIRHIEEPYVQLQAIQYACLAYFLTGQERLDYLEKSVAAFSYSEMLDFIIPHILTEIADYATPDLISHLLGWLSDYPVASALEKLAPKIVENDAWLAQGFAIAQRIDDSVDGFICSSASKLDKEWITKAVIFVMKRDLAEEQKRCMPMLVDRWLQLSRQEIYEVWLDVLEKMKVYPRPKVLMQLSWFATVIIRLSGQNNTVSVLKEVLSVWSWWDVVWQKPAGRLDIPPG